MNETKTYDVFIAGGGPVGLFLACELRLAGASVLLLEKNETPSTPLKSGWMGARGLNFPSTEAFYRRGLLDEVKAASFGWMRRRPSRHATHRRRQKPPSRRLQRHALPATSPASCSTPTSSTSPISNGSSPAHPSAEAWSSLEAIERPARRPSPQARRRPSLRPRSDRLHRNPRRSLRSNNQRRLHRKWLIGCDGGRSTVRRLAGFDFEGTEPELTGYMAIVEFEDLDNLAPGFNLTPRGMYTHGPAPGKNRCRRLRRRPLRPHLRHHARKPAGHVAAGLRNQRHAQVRAGRHQLHRPCPAGNNLSQRPHPPRRRRSPRPLSLRRTGHERRPRRRHESGMEASRNHQRLGARRPARHLHRRAPSHRRVGPRTGRARR